MGLVRSDLDFAYGLALKVPPETNKEECQHAQNWIEDLYNKKDNVRVAGHSMGRKKIAPV